MLFNAIGWPVVSGKTGWLYAALFCVCLVGCASGVPVESDVPSVNPAAVAFCQRQPESVLCR